MAKAYLAAMLEDLVGEYVLNISKENLKLAALRGRITLENVELDGDFIGSQILSGVGLSGFGVLSCWARTLKINIPWTNLAAPTSLEIRGMHLVCVPLLSTTSGRLYYGSQTLRTRAKRSALARFERNFFSGRIVGEGPQQEFHQNDGETLSYNDTRRKRSSSEDVDDDGEKDFGESISSSPDAVEISLANSIYYVSGQEAEVASSTVRKKEAGIPAFKQRVKAKIYENLISSVTDVHIRCEIPEGGLNMSLNGTIHVKSDEPTSEIHGTSDQNAFAFGLTLKSLSVRNISKVQLKNENDDSGSKSHKKVEIEDLSIYWDDDPSFLISESDLLNGLLSLTAAASQQRIAEAMEQMSTKQNPGIDVVRTLSKRSPPAKNTPFRVTNSRAHDYICSKFSLTMLTTSTTNETSEDSLCFAQILPCRLDLVFTSQQYKQYQLLQNAVFSQQRFDTMLHCRPQKSPLEDPRSWWTYAIACVKHKPAQNTSRSWKDMHRIVQCRKVYLELVVKNLSCEPEKRGLHGALTEDESRILDEYESFLPIETLLSFHLVALRRVYANRTHKINGKKPRRERLVRSFTRRRSSSALGRLLNSITGYPNSWQTLEDEPTLYDNDNPPARQEHKLKSSGQLHSCKVKLTLGNVERMKLVTVEIDVKGTSYLSGSGRADLTFDITRFEVFDFVNHEGTSSGKKVMIIAPDSQEFDCKQTVIQNDFFDSHGPSKNSTSESSEMRLPPNGVVCRATAMLDVRAVFLDLSAHPATLVWSKTCADSVADFFSSSTHQIQNKFLRQLQNAATPVAHRAQMALFFPTSLSISIDVNAPKLWIPVSHQMQDGALFVDSGKLKMVLDKAEQSSESNWNMYVANIQIMLAGSRTVLDRNKNDAADLGGVSQLRKELTTIVQPFQIDVWGHVTGSLEEQMEPLQEPHPPANKLTDFQVGTGRISVKVGVIRLNLVDVEELAKAIGRFYASGVVMMQKKSNCLEAPSERDDSLVHELSLVSHHQEVSAFDIIHVCFDKLEVAMECYSSQRTYLVELHTIKWETKNKGPAMSFSRLSISDFTVQLADANCDQSIGSSVRYLKPSIEPQHQLLARKQAESEQRSEVGIHGHLSSNDPVPNTPQTPKRKLSPQTPLRTPKLLRLQSSSLVPSPSQGLRGTEFVKGCHFHDEENHVDEVEIDVASAILKVTPTSISDCTIWLARAVELIRIATKEMERRVHERGRKARTTMKRKGKSKFESISGVSEGISYLLLDEAVSATPEESRDSSIIIRVTFKEAAVLVGRPASEFTCSRGRKPTDYVVQILTNASIMTQSIENVNGTGSRTFHISMDDFSASVNPDFQYVKLSDDAFLLNPTAVDCRIVQNTVREGHVSFQDFSFDCESMKWCLSPHDIRVVSSVVRKVTERLKLLQTTSDDKSRPSLSSLLHPKKKGSRIATKVRAELHSCSFIASRSFKSKTGLRPCINLFLQQLKISLEGCIDALHGEVVTILQVKYFNPESDGWEDIVQANRCSMVVDQIPNEVVFWISSPDVINVNLTGGLIQEVSDLESMNRTESEAKGIRRPQKLFSFINETGIDVVIGVDIPHNRSLQCELPDSDDDHLHVPSGSIVSLNSSFIRLRDSSTLFLGAKGRQIINKLPLFHTLSSKRFLYKWYPFNASLSYVSNWKERGDIEPVVELVMQNQRLRPDISDISSLQRGQDLLSSSAWSPVSAVAREGTICNKPHPDQIWLPPYLKDDAYEWSDTANIMKLNKDSFDLPDKDWMWVDSWEVEIDVNTDFDGWEYATDFETFSMPPRSYRRGDLCRRRRWTRARMIKQSGIARVLPIVWGVRPDESGSVIIARSHVQLHNQTSLILSFFGFRHSWDNEQYIGKIRPGQSLCVPVELASATHLLLATKKSHSVHSTSQNIDCFFATEKLMILPTGFTSSRIIRASIHCEHNVDGFLSIKKLHFLLTLKCVEGVVDLHIEPALKVINLLPCQLQCQLGEIGCSVRKGNRNIVQTEVLSLSAGKEGNCLSIDCYLSPHIAARVPGYKWSSWKKIVCRESNSHTWWPTEEEEVALFEACKGSAKHAREFKSIVHLDYKTSGGNPLDIIMSIELGHSPVIRFYAQFWMFDKTGLGLNFTGGFSDIMATAPQTETLRKSYSSTEAKDRFLKLDMEREGHEWSMGLHGMTLFFSRDEKLALQIATRDSGDTEENSQWSSLIDVSNVMPENVKTAISIDQNHGKRRYELAYNITLCPSVFSRTRMITLFPRYIVLNLLGESLYIAQDGVLSAEICIPSQSSIHFHWEKSTLSPKVRLCAASGSWSRGCIHLDKIGVTALRLPHTNNAKPTVVQAEVRLATKKEDSAAVVTIWALIEKSNPLYLLKNISHHHTIYCRQWLSEDGSGRDDGFIWQMNSGESIGFGFDDPEEPHILQWTWSNPSKFISAVEVDAMGSKSTIALPNGRELMCEIKAEQSTKVILFSDSRCVGSRNGNDDNDDEIVAITLQIDLSGFSLSIIDNASNDEPGREILLLTTDGWHVNFSQSREGFHELELRMKTLQVDNFIFDAEFPVVIHCPSNEDIPFLHLSAVRSLQEHRETLVFSYCALKFLEGEIYLDRKTAETIARFLHPLRKAREEDKSDENWISSLTLKMKTRYSRPNKLRDIEKMVLTSNSGRIYFEKLHLHPIRLSLTFSQEGLEWNPVTEGLVIFQLIRGMASIANAPLIFTSFVVSHAFESPSTLLGIISAHYSSQLSSQILTILGSLVILKAPADILSNVGAGVRDFFYEPINGLVHGPAEFLEGLESGTSSLARGVFTGLIRGTASVTEIVSHNLAHLTSDDVFIGERNAYQKKLMQALKVDQARRTMQESLVVAGSCVARGFRSGANGIFEQPSIYASRHGTAGLVKGVGKAVIGAIVKPVVGVGDAAVIVMNHVSETTSDKLLAIAKANKRMRRALPCVSVESCNNIKLIPYDEKSANVQQIVTSGETEDDAYLGHVQTPSYLIIASVRYLWVIGDSKRDPRRIRWVEISHFGIHGNSMKVDVFSGQGPHSFTFEMSPKELADLFQLLLVRMGSASHEHTTDLDLSLRGNSHSNLPGIKTIQYAHVFGSVNRHFNIDFSDLNDLFFDSHYTRVNRMGSFMPNFFQLIDQEAWLLISYVDQMFTGLSSRRCISAGVINGTGETIQVKTAKLIQGGSPCYTFPTIEYDKKQGVLHPGGAIIFFGWGAVPNLLQPGNVLISIETNLFVSKLTDSISQSATIQSLPSWQIVFLEKSYDESGWWAKYWILAKKKMGANTI